MSEEALSGLITARDELLEKIKTRSSKKKLRDLADLEVQISALSPETISLDGLVFKNPSAALEYLTDSGYKVSRSKWFRDVKKGLVRTREGKIVGKDLKDYIATLENYADKEDPDELQKKKLQLEVEKLQEDVLKKRFSREIDEGKYYLKEDVDATNAMKLSFLDAEFKSMIRSRAQDMVESVKGDTSLMEDLIQILYEEIDLLFNDISELGLIDVEN